jgi:hypothetical protein
MTSGTPARHWTFVEERLGALYRCRADVGTPPPQVPSLRGRVGMWLVLATRRALFWLLPQLDRFHTGTIAMAEDQLAALDELAAAYERVDAAVGQTLAEFAQRHRELTREVALLRAEVAALSGSREQ